MPNDTQRSLDDIKADLDYFKRAQRAAAPGSQPPTVYADRYVQDVETLLKLLGEQPTRTMDTPAGDRAEPKGEQVQAEAAHDAEEVTERADRAAKTDPGHRRGR